MLRCEEEYDFETSLLLKNTVLYSETTHIHQSQTSTVMPLEPVTHHQSFICWINTSTNKSLQQRSLHEQGVPGSLEHLEQPN